MDKEFFVKNKKKIIISIVILAVALIGFSLVNSTYSLFYHEETASNTESYSTGLLSIVASSKGETISLNNTLPISDTDGINTTPYTFTINNTCNSFIAYSLNLEELEGSTLSSKYIMTMVNGKAYVNMANMASLMSTDNYYANSVESRVRVTGSLGPNASINYSLRLWIDEEHQ